MSQVDKVSLTLSFFNFLYFVSNWPIPKAFLKSIMTRHTCDDLETVFSIILREIICVPHYNCLFLFCTTYFCTLRSVKHFFFSLSNGSCRISQKKLGIRKKALRNYRSLGIATHSKKCLNATAFEKFR